MRKKSLAIVSVLILLLFTLLVGCGSNQTSNQQQATSNTSNESSSTNESKEPTPADDFPNKPITLVVPFSAGGAGDTMSRTFAKVAEKYIGQSIVVVNKDGASGALAMQHLLQQPEDGYTFLYQSSTLPLTMASGKIPFVPEDIDSIATVVSNYQALAVPVDSPYETLDDFIQYAKENPGILKVGSTGINSTNHVFALKVMEDAEIDLTYVSYDGGGETVTAILGGNIDAIAASGEVVQQQVDEGNLRILAVTSTERVPSHPDVPTFKELGLTSLDDELIWRAFFIKPGTPQERIDKYIEVISQVIEDPEWQKYLENTKQDVYFKSGEELNKIFTNYYESGKTLFEKYK